MRKLQVGSRKFRGKLPFKCFSCGRVGHYESKCPYKENHKENGKNVSKKKFSDKKIFYSNEGSNNTSDYLENSDSDSNNHYQVLMGFED